MSEHIRKVTIPALLLVLTVSVPLTLDAAGSDDKPNVVLILMDNFGYGEPGVYGGGAIRGAPTPNIDSIAHEGIQLTNYNVDAECTPSRTSLMSGRYSMRTRLRQDGPPRGAWYGLTQWEYTLAEFLSDAGYATGMFGKWHLGDTEGRFPTDQGFDEWWGIPRSSDRSFWPDSASYQDDAGARFIHIMSSMRGETPTELEVYGRQKRATFDREVTDRALDYIERKAGEDQPFFLYMPYMFHQQLECRFHIVLQKILIAQLYLQYSPSLYNSFSLMNPYYQLS